jgi:hypothetical protein
MRTKKLTELPSYYDENPHIKTDTHSFRLEKALTRAAMIRIKSIQHIDLQTYVHQLIRADLVKGRGAPFVFPAVRAKYLEEMHSKGLPPPPDHVHFIARN